jgi:hypothetical protein
VAPGDDDCLCAGEAPGGSWRAAATAVLAVAGIDLVEAEVAAKARLVLETDRFVVSQPFRG